MSSYGEPDASKQEAGRQIMRARERALEAVSQRRQADIGTPHPNLAMPSNAQDKPTLPVLCTQAAMGYLLQLRPYRTRSMGLGIDLGTITLPKSIDGGTSKRLGADKLPDLWLCRQPTVSLRSISEIVHMANSDIHYATRDATHTDDSGYEPALTGRELPDGVEGVTELPGRVVDAKLRFSTSEHGNLLFATTGAYEAVLAGDVSAEEALDTGMAVRESDVDDDTDTEPSEYQPPSPLVGDDGRIEKYKFVFGPNALLQIVELADEIAAELDFLADIDEPDHRAAAGDAV